jgi:hypothetical protein
MRLIMVSAPEGLGDEVAKTAFSIGIEKLSRRQVTSQHADGKIEIKDVVDVETSTPQGKRYVDEVLAADYFNREDYMISVRAPRSIISSTGLRKLTEPLAEPATDILEELWQFTHITYGFVGRVLIAACLMAYGLIEQKMLLIIAGLLFLPLLPLLLSISFGIKTKTWKLAANGAMAFIAATILLFIGGAAIASISNPPVKFDDFNTLLVGFLITLAVSIAAVLASIDDAGRRELIGLAATAQIAIIPVWFGVCVVLGFPATVQTKEILNRGISFPLNVLTVIVVTFVLYLVTGAASSSLEKVKID